MTHIKILQGIAGDRWGYDAGQILRLGIGFGAEEIPADLGRTLCDGVRAEPFRLPGVDVETEARQAPETMAVRGGPRATR